jgi:hypothetical protein
MKTLRCVLAVLGILVFLVTSPSRTSAYNLDTHAALSREAFRRAGIAERLTSYGLGPSERIRGRILSLRQAPRRAEEWVAWGARDEDFPPDRARNHFYDPHYDRGLTIAGFSGTRAPDWALEGGGEFLLQRHSYRDAREGFYGGLTLADSVTRERELGYTLYALGHVIHLIQDVTVPEHARNDSHFSVGPDKSFLEGYLEKNIAAFTPTDVKLPIAGLPTVALARELWANPAAGTGIAQFTNANFVSPDTNFTEARTGATAAEYPSPVLDLARTDTGSLGRCKDIEQPLPSPGSLTFFGNVMVDPVSPDPANPTLLTNPRMTTHSVFDQYLKNRGKRLVFSLNCFTVDAAAELLLPRAASYSASLLEFFFRGRLTAIFGGNAFRVVNRTHDARRAETMDGRFELYRDDAFGQRQLLAAWTLRLDANWMTGPLSVPLLADGQYARCMLVFRGRLGAETDGVAGQQLDRCPTSTTIAGDYEEVGRPTGPGAKSAGCANDGFWFYLIEICCYPSSPPNYASYCASSPQGAIVACQSSTAWWLVCRLPS